MISVNLTSGTCGRRFVVLYGGFKTNKQTKTEHLQEDKVFFVCFFFAQLPQRWMLCLFTHKDERLQVDEQKHESAARLDESSTVSEEKVCFGD